MAAPPAIPNSTPGAIPSTRKAKAANICNSSSTRSSRTLMRTTVQNRIVFGKAGIFAPAYWFAPAVADYTAAHTLSPHTKIYFYAGGKEGEEMVGNMQAIIALMRQHGLADRDVSVHVEPEAKHNEVA